MKEASQRVAYREVLGVLKLRNLNTHRGFIFPVE
jgi:hypothetical protein